MPNGLDANPIEVLYDICINDWGMLGITDPDLQSRDMRKPQPTKYIPRITAFRAR
jgi:hypothetical protein